MKGGLEWRATVWSLVVGVIIAMGAVLISTAVSLLAGTPPTDSASRAFSSTLLLEWIVVGVALSPLLETLLFSLLANLVLRIPTLGGAIFVLLMAGVGWLIHGADLESLSRTFGFLVLALWFLACLRQGGPMQAYLQTFLAHASWNLVLVLLWAARALA